MIGVGTSTGQAAERALWMGFSSRAPRGALTPSQPVPEARTEDTWRALVETASAPRRARLLHVQVPFCATHCSFCSFYRAPHRHDRGEAFTELVIEEMIQASATMRARTGPIHAVQVGGCAPTGLSTAQLCKILNTIRFYFPLASDCEVTVAGRIADLDDRKVEACLEAGANRFAIDVQSFDTQLRYHLGRREGRRPALAYLERLLAQGQATVSIDLALGLPGQTQKTWQEDLQACRDLQPDGVHVHVHDAPDPKSRRCGRRRALPRAALTELVSMYEAAAAQFEGAGWVHIINGHFARGTRERNSFELLSASADRLAFGPGASGRFDDTSFRRTSDLEHWSDAIRHGVPAIQSLMRAPAGESVRTEVVTEIERGRVSPKALSAAGLAEPAHAEVVRTLKDWCRNGLAEARGHDFVLTPAGRFWSTNLTHALVERLTPPDPDRVEIDSHNH